MENTANGILAGLGTMLVAVILLSTLVWLAYRMADRS
jgi:type IV secretory pathway TrbF-like protein